jgi:hypothetical protein
MGQARPLEVFLCDAAFNVTDSVYVGPVDGLSESDWKEARVALPPTGLACRIPGQVATVDLVGREAELIAHYERVITIAEAHGRMASLREPFPYFAVGPTIIGEDQALADFSWSDDVAETKAVLEALAGASRGGDGILWDDIEQGWQLRMAVQGGSVFFVEWDAEGPPPADAAYTVDAAIMARQATEALERLATMHGRLTAALGRDYWTYCRRPQEPRMGGIRRTAQRLLAAVRRWR